MKNLLKRVKSHFTNINNVKMFIGKCYKLHNYVISFFMFIVNLLKNILKISYTLIEKIIFWLLENNLLFIFFFIFIIFFFFLDLNSFFSLNVVIPEDPRNNNVVLPNEIFDFNVFNKSGKIILPMTGEYPTEIIISETFNPHSVKTITYAELLDFFYNEMLVNDDFFETDLTIIELYHLILTSDLNYFYYYYYYYLFCYKLLTPLDRFRFTRHLRYENVPSPIWVLRDKFLVQRKRKVLFFVLKQGLDLVRMVLKEKKKKKEKIIFKRRY